MWDKDKKASSLPIQWDKISHHTVGLGENASPAELTQGLLTQAGEGGPILSARWSSPFTTDYLKTWAQAPGKHGCSF